MNRSKHIFILLAALLVSSAAFSQDKKIAEGHKKGPEYKVSNTIKNVRALLKDQKYSDANNEINKALKDHEQARSTAYLYSLQTNALYNLVLDENKKMYLNQKPDTAKYFGYIMDMYNAALKCDSLENIPDAKGRVVRKYRSSSHQRLMQFRKNLSTADKFFYQRKDYKRAYEYADLYLTSRRSPIFNTEKGVYSLDAENDSISHASLAVFLAYAYNNKQGVVRYLPTALSDTTRLSQLLEVGSKTYYELQDTAYANELLYTGLNKFPTNEYFYMTLVKYYNARSEYSKALEIIEKVQPKLANNRNCCFLKAKEHEYLKDYDKAIESLQDVIKIDESDAEAYSTIGSIYLQLAHDAYDNFNLKITDKGYSAGREKIMKYYRSARSAYEESRKNAEDKSELWLSGLRECYYKLNLGKELRQLEDIK